MALVELREADGAAATPAGLSDAAVVQRVLAGERALFEVLMRRYNQRVFRAIRSVLRGDHESEDAMQQAWLAAYTHLGQFQGTASFSTWMTRIALNEALRRAGRRPHLAAVEDVSEEDESMRSKTRDPEERAADRELGRMVEAAVDGLPALYRSVFVLREIEGMSTADAAAALGVSQEVVKVRLRRARLALQDWLHARLGSTAREAFAFLGWRCDRVVANVMGRILAGPPPD